jgi:hypothetical protein
MKVELHKSNKKQTIWPLVILAAMLLIGFAIRVYDITDLPLDFHPTAQMCRAITARGLFYNMQPSAPAWEREQAIIMWKVEKIEPPGIDGLAAVSWLIASEEILWLPRLYSIIFWLIGGVGLYLLAKDMTSQVGGLAALGIYLFVPFAIIGSRTFQPDPLMIALNIFGWWAMYRWHLKGTWKWAILAGVFCGLAIFIKALAAFAVLAGFIGLLLMRGFKKCFKDWKFWVMGILAVMPEILFMIYGFFIQGSLGNQFVLRFFPEMWIDPVFYLQWERMLEEVIGLLLLTLALIGIFFHEKIQRKFIIALWGGYVVFAILFSHWFATHSYYHLTLIPIVGLSLAAFVDSMLQKYRERKPSRIMNGVLIAILVVGFGANLWDVRDTLHRVDYRPQQAFWEEIGEVLGRNPSVIALTQDYGYRLEYWGWVKPQYWPYTGDDQLRGIEDMTPDQFEQRFLELTDGIQYFLVTDSVEFAKQPYLELQLQKFPVVHEGEEANGLSYTIYDLFHPLASPALP